MMWTTQSVSLAEKRAPTGTPESALSANKRVNELRDARMRSGSVPPGGLWDIVTSFDTRARASSQPNRPRSKTQRLRTATGPTPGLPPDAQTELNKPESTADVTEMTLRHCDFCPRRSKKLADATESEQPVYETYFDVLQRANVWLHEHPDVILVTMETMTWCVSYPAAGKPVQKHHRRGRTPTASDVFKRNYSPLEEVSEDGDDLLESTVTSSSEQREHVFTDSTVTHRSRGEAEDNRFYRGIRLWYFFGGEKFWRSWVPKRQLHFRDYFPSRNGSVASVLLNINEDLKTNPIIGSVLRLDTVDVPHDQGSTSCVWSVNPSTDTRYYSVFRLVYVEFEGADEFKAQIGFRDFLPAQDIKAPSTSGYQKFEEVFARAARWLYKQKQFHIINLQTLPVKAKTTLNKDHLENVHLWENASHTQHGQKPTNYFLLLRVAYWLLPPDATNTSLPPRLSYRTATPAFTGRPASDQRDRLFQPEEFEDASQTVEKISSWLNKSRSRLLSIETIPIRCQSSGQSALGPESSVLRHESASDVIPETLIYCLRVYIEGEFLAVPFERKWRPLADMVSGGS